MPPRPEAALPACILGLLLPGGGQLYLGRREKGIFFLLAISALFVLGVAMDARVQIYLGFDDPLALIISLGQAATGLPYVLTKALGYDVGRITSVTYDYGITFTAVAGLLNILIVLDAYDTALGRKP